MCLSRRLRFMHQICPGLRVSCLSTEVNAGRRIYTCICPDSPTTRRNIRPSSQIPAKVLSNAHTTSLSQVGVSLLKLKDEWQDPGRLEASSAPFTPYASRAHPRPADGSCRGSIITMIITIVGMPFACQAMTLILTTWCPRQGSRASCCYLW